MKTILITGGAGFIGSHLIPYWLNKYPDHYLVNVDKLTYAARLDNLREVMFQPRYHFIQGDIVNRTLVETLFQQFNFQGVLHLAAESHVDRSIQDPTLFIKTNIEGTFILLDVARLHWIESPGVHHLDSQASRFLYVSTDEVYGSLDQEGFFTEKSPYAPNNPYSATKAAGDLLVRSYVHTYGLHAITTHASNTYGPQQYVEKLIPTIIQCALSQQPIPIHGQGTSIRDWLHVLDHCKGLDSAFHHGEKGEHYNFGGNNQKTNLQIAYHICQILDELVPLSQQQSYSSLVTFVADRPGNDKRYAVDITKATNKLGWQPQEDFKQGLQQTIVWYVNGMKQTSWSNQSK